MMEVSAFDLQEFQLRLEDTIAWYLAKAPIADLYNVLRTNELAPSGDFAHPMKQAWVDFPRPWTDEMWEIKNRAESQAPQVRQAIVDEVARKRRALLGAARLDHSQRAKLLSKGRLLTYIPEENMFDGAAESATRGFFDVDNVPPWDLWLVYIVEKLHPPVTYLLAWIPPGLIELATTGIEVNPEKCICWAEDVDAEFVRQLRSVGMLH